MKPFAKMRTITAKLSAVLLLLCAFWAGDVAAQSATTVSIPTVSAEAGETAAVPVNVENFNNVGAITLVINFNADVLTFEGLANAPRNDFNANVPSEGELRVAWFDATASSPINLGDGKLLDLNFSFSGGTGELTFDSGESEVADADANAIDVTFENGVVSSDVGSLSLGISEDVALGATASIALSAEDLNNVGSVSLELGYDPAVLQFDQLANDQSGLNLTAGAQDGTVTIGGFNTDGVDLSGSIAELEFTFLGGSSAVSFQDVEVADSLGTELAVGFEGGSISGVTPEISLPNTVAVPGDTVSVPVNAEGLASVGSISLEVQFNNAALEFVGTENALENFNFSSNQPSTGVVRLAGFSTAGVDVGEKIVDLRFVASEGASDLTFNESGSEVTNTAGAAYNVAYEGGQVRAEQLLLGDVQGNGVVDAGDASLVLQAAVDLITLNSVQIAAADVDASGTVDAADASLILQHVVGAIDKFPAEEGSAAFAKSLPDADASLNWGELTPIDGSDSYQLPIMISGSDRPVTAGQMTIRYNPSSVTIEEVASSLPSGWQVFHNTKRQDGVLKIAMAGVDALEAGQLVTLTVTPKDGSEPSFSGEATLNAGVTQDLGQVGSLQLPESVTLRSNYPNPFRGATNISYGLPSDEKVLLEVYNIAGQKVATLVNQQQSAGVHEVTFDASGLASGMYMYRIQVGNVVKTGNMTLVK